MSVARPLTGPEVKTCLLASMRQAAVEAGLTPDSFARTLSLWLDSHSILARENLTYPHVRWDIEVTVETPRKQFGSRESLEPWLSAHVEVELGNNQLLTQRFGHSAPLTLDCDTTIGKRWQEETRYPDRIRERWLGNPVEAPEASPEPQVGEPEAPPVRNFVTIQDLPDEDLLGTPPVVPTEAMAPAPAPEEPAPSALVTPPQRRGRKSKA